MGVNSLPKTVTRQRRDFDLNPGPSAPVSSALTTRLPLLYQLLKKLFRDVILYRSAMSQCISSNAIIILHYASRHAARQ